MKKITSYSLVEDFVDHVINTKDLNKKDLIVDVFSLIKDVNRCDELHKIKIQNPLDNLTMQLI